MDNNEIRSRRASIRKEIKGRMQAQLDESKKKIKRRLKRADMSVGEKRECYRRETQEEKLRLMAMAKQEFRARRKMLGHVSAEEEEDVVGRGYPEEILSGPKEPLSDLAGRENIPEEDADAAEPEEFHDEYDPDEAFLLEDTTEEREALKEFEAPIEEQDSLPSQVGQFGDETGIGADHESEDFEVEGLFYYACNLIFHPIRTLDEFDDYLITPPGLRNVAIFYLLSLLPFGVFFYVAQNTGMSLPGGTAESLFPAQFGIIGAMLNVVAGLLIYSAAVAAINYLFADEANFVALTAYFAFVEGVTGIIVYAMLIAAVIAVFLAPSLLLLVFGLLIALVIWKFVLKIIVLMNAYGYGFFSAFFLNLGAGILIKLAFIFFSGAVLGKSLEDTLYPPSF